MPKPSPASVLSVLALFVSLGGTGYAATQIPRNSVGTKHLRHNAVTSAKVKNGALVLTDFRASARTKLHGKDGVRGAAGAAGARGLIGANGLRGSAGLQGNQGLQGDPGAPGATGVEQVVVRTTGFTFSLSTGAGQTQSDDVQCQAGESVVGGGADVVPNASSASQPNTIITVKPAS